MQELTTESINAPQSKEGIIFDVGSLMTVLHQIQDPRAARGVRYSLVTLLVLLILAKLAGEDGMKGMSEWIQLRAKKLAALLKLSRETMPHQTTYERVLADLDEVEGEHKLGQFLPGNRQKTSRSVSMAKCYVARFHKAKHKVHTYWQLMYLKQGLS